MGFEGLELRRGGRRVGCLGSARWDAAPSRSGAGARTASGKGLSASHESAPGLKPGAGFIAHASPLDRDGLLGHPERGLRQSRPGHKEAAPSTPSPLGRPLEPFYRQTLLASDVAFWRKSDSDHASAKVLKLVARGLSSAADCQSPALDTGAAARGVRFPLHRRRCWRVGGRAVRSAVVPAA
jgi:hypothetical protein